MDNLIELFIKTYIYSMLALGTIYSINKSFQAIDVSPNKLALFLAGVIVGLCISLIKFN